MEKPTEEKKVVLIPGSITIGEITYVIKDTPELQSLIAAVAKVEKDKLYSQFESLKTQVNQLGNVQVQETPKAPLDVEALKKDIVGEITSQLKTIVQPMLQATQDSKQEELRKYKESIINSNLDKCIPELVKGETVEELNTSLAESVALRAKYLHPVNNVTPKDPLMEVAAAKLEKEVTEEKVNVAQVPKREAPDGFGVPENIQAMSMEEFGKRREALQDTLKSMYP